VDLARLHGRLQRLEGQIPRHARSPSPALRAFRAPFLFAIMTAGTGLATAKSRQEIGMPTG
ncbi:MAG: hypothetical protein ACOVLI_06035, partial [Rhabdaerophilum sp.]